MLRRPLLWLGVSADKLDDHVAILASASIFTAVTLTGLFVLMAALGLVGAFEPTSPSP